MADLIPAGHRKGARSGADRTWRRGAGIELYAELARLVRRQHGIVARWQLLAAGWSRREIQSRVRSGSLIRMYRGVYAVGHVPSEPKARLVAAVLACGERAVLSHESAGAFWGICAPPDRFTLIVPNRGAAGPKPFRLHRTGTLLEDEHLVVDGLAVTTVARTLLDLASLGDEERVEAAMAAADRNRQLRHGAVRRVLSRPGRRPGTPLLRRVYSRHDPDKRPTRSEFERQVHRRLERAGIAPSDRNVIVDGREVDMLWRAQRLMVELDGARYHSGDTSFNADRARDLAFSLAGYRVIRISWPMFRDDPDGVVEKLGKILSGSHPSRAP